MIAFFWHSFESKALQICGTFLCNKIKVFLSEMIYDKMNCISLQIEMNDLKKHNCWQLVTTKILEDFLWHWGRTHDDLKIMPKSFRFCLHANYRHPWIQWIYLPFFEKYPPVRYLFVGALWWVQRTTSLMSFFASLVMRHLFCLLILKK